MTNLEFYKDKLIDVLAEHTRVDRNGNPHACNDCFDCVFSGESNCRKATKKWLLAEHQEQVKLKQWEYDILKHCDNGRRTYIQMKELGYFKGITDTSMPLEAILDNCIIVADDYDFEGKRK